MLLRFFHWYLGLPVNVRLSIDRYNRHSNIYTVLLVELALLLNDSKMMPTQTQYQQQRQQQRSSQRIFRVEEI
jgi:hypothetical protein